jgi:hypothetical protein
MTPVRVLPKLPDPYRLGGPAWLEKEKGVLSNQQCIHGAAIATRQQIQNIWERVTAGFRRSASLDGFPPVPDSRLVRVAEEAAMEQNVELRSHGVRTALFGRALAFIDKVQLDPELLHVCGLLHDVGLMKAVTGEDFTVRSANVARKCACDAGEAQEVGEHLSDALMVHTTVGVDPHKDGALGAYTQYGAMVDLTGLRLSALPQQFVTDVLVAHPRGALKREILSRLSAEAAAVPGGRFAFARKVGLPLAIKLAPFKT